MALEPTIHDELLPEQIRQAALQLYLKYGLKKVTMDDVSKAIGKSRSALYYYYKNRDEIFEAVMNSLIEEIHDEIEKAVDKALHLRQKIRAFCIAKVKTSEAKKGFFLSMEAGMDAEEISRHNQMMSQLHTRLVQSETSILHNVFSGAVKNGEMRILKPREVATLELIVLSSIRGIRREMRHQNDFSRLEETVDLFTEMIINWVTK